MKKVKGYAVIAIVGLSFVMGSCKKDECHECHYDGPNGEIELGEKCGDDLEDIEANGYAVDGVVYEVHCHEH
ncbi:MAG: hypothetical protein NWQ27_03645 [Crocinitomicaceae bacterium]|jgi:hypothetical protein|nr:hypothetical protein [Crocinitomicaceae bacterium]